MVNALKQTINLQNSFIPAIIMFGLLITASVIIFGADAAAPGVHEAFHDFRHALGMACH